MRSATKDSDVDDLYAALLQRTRAEADRAGLTPRELAAEAAISEDRALSIVEGSARDVTLWELVGVALALGLPVTSLLSS
jgi:hypothetical protein